MNRFIFIYKLLIPNLDIMKIKLVIIFSLLIFPYITKSQERIENINTKELNDAIEMLGVDIFKFSFDSIENDYGLKLYLEEITKDSVITRVVKNFGQWKNGSKHKKLKIISNTKKDSVAAIKLLHPNMEIMTKFDIKSIYRNAHYWKPIKQNGLNYDEKTPLIFYGMSWEDEYEGKKIRRFCWGDEITRKMDNENLDKIEHMILISYKLVKPSSKTCRQKDMNRTRLPAWQAGINADLFIKVNNPLKFSFTNHSK